MGLKKFSSLFGFSNIRFFFLYSTVVILTLNSGCNDSIIEPDTGRRDYEWSFEALDMSGTQNFEPDNIWGPSAINLWIAGQDIGKTLLWHYNGNSWQRESISNSGFPVQLWGTSSENLWLLDMDGHIWKYNGSEWYSFSEISPPEGFNNVMFFSMCGNSADDVYFLGSAEQNKEGTGDYKGVIMHYKNGKWNYMNIPEVELRFLYMHKQKSTGSYFISGYYFENGEHKSKIYKYDGKNSLIEISSGYGLTELNGEVYFLGEQKIYVYTRGRLVLRKNFTGTDYMGGMMGRSENDFFCKDKYFNLLHYNGSDFKRIYNENMMVLGNGCVFDKDAFFLVKKKGQVLVLHGALK